MSIKKQKVFSVADYFVHKNNQAHKGDLTNKKLQKLLYYAQAWSIVLHEKKLFKDDIEAWIHGPAVPCVYHAFKMYGFSPITKKVGLEDFETLDSSEIKLLDSVWSIYGKYDAGYLEQLTHNEDPWILARKGVELYESSNNVISAKSMKDYYVKKIKSAKK